MNRNDKSTSHNPPRNSNDDAQIPAVQHALWGLPEGVELDLFSDELLEEAAAVDDDECTELEEEPWLAESVECAKDLQQKFQFDSLGRRKPVYRNPSRETLAACATGRTSRKNIEHGDGLEHVARMSDVDLADRVWWIAETKRDGLSELDLAVQREWTGRSFGAGWYEHKNCQLPFDFMDLGGHRSAYARRLIICVLMLAIVNGRNGFSISAPQAWELWKMPNGVWWDAIKWLEEHGFLVRLRRYKNNDDGPAPVHKTSNWYGPGPELLKLRVKILGVFGGKTEEAKAAAKAARAEAKQHRQGRRRITARRRNEARRLRAGHPSKARAGRDAPDYALRIVEAGRRIERRRAQEVRRRLIAAGDPRGFRATGDQAEAEVLEPLEPDQATELERAAEAGAVTTLPDPADPGVMNVDVGTRQLLERRRAKLLEEAECTASPQVTPRGPRSGVGRCSSSGDGPSLAAADVRSPDLIDVRQTDATLRVRNFAVANERSGERTSAAARDGPSPELEHVPTSLRGSPVAPMASPATTTGVDPPPAARTSAGAERLAPGQVFLPVEAGTSSSGGGRDG